MIDKLQGSYIKLTDDTIIQFETAELVKISRGETVDLIYHKDILLFLSEIFVWCKVSDFLEFFGEDKQTGFNILNELYSNKMLQSSDSGNEVLTQTDNLAKFASSNISLKFNIHNHHLMLKDYARVASYKQAIESIIKENDTVLELGCGSGILSLIAAKCNPKKVFSIEINKEILNKVAIPMAKSNSLDDKISFLAGNSLNIKEEEINPKASVFIAEILGDEIFNENILSYTIDARERFLTPDAQMIPKGLDVYLFCYQSSNENISNLNTDSNTLQYVGSAGKSERFDGINSKILTNPTKAIDIDLINIEEPYFSTSGELTVINTGRLDKCCLYFVANLNDKHYLSNSPWSPQISWTQQIHNVSQAKILNIGDKISFKLDYKQSLTLTLEY